MLRRLIVTVAWGLVGATLLAACSHAGAHGAVRRTTPPPSAQAFAERVAQLVEGHAADAPWALRYNPVRCACPPWEVRLGDAWVRCAVEPGDDEAARVLAAARPGASLQVIGTAHDELVRCPGTQAPVVKLEVESVVAAPGSAP